MSDNYVMVVEDDQDIRENLQELLEFEGYGVLLAENGKAALELLQNQVSLPSVILLDLMMPIMDGKMFMRTIHNFPQLKEIPIVLITAGGDKLEENVAGFMKKPLDLEEVLRVVRKFSREN